MKVRRSTVSARACNADTSASVAGRTPAITGAHDSQSAGEAVNGVHAPVAAGPAVGGLAVAVSGLDDEADASVAPGAGAPARRHPATEKTTAPATRAVATSRLRLLCTE
ncbi:hypothetical protein GCM10009845_11490 [Pedococcus bigeumensis]